MFSPKRSRLKDFVAALVMLMACASPSIGAEEAVGGFQKLGNVVLSMWDKEGNFHTIVIKMSAYFPSRPQLPKNLADEIKHRMLNIPYEEFRKPGGTMLIKNIARQVLLDNPDSANVEDVNIVFLSFQ
jgi:hypothetical protein